MRSRGTPDMVTRPALQADSRLAILPEHGDNGLPELERQLARCWQWLCQHAQAPLPEPLPAAILVFSMATDDSAVHVFHVCGDSLAQAWRAGARRVRHWVWRQRASAVTLRIDWVEDVLAPSEAVRMPGQDVRHAWIDRRFAHVLLAGPYFHGEGWARAGRMVSVRRRADAAESDNPLTAADASAQDSWLQLRLRGLCCTPGAHPVALPRPALAMPLATGGWHPLAAAAAHLMAPVRPGPVAAQVGCWYTKWLLAAAQVLPARDVLAEAGQWVQQLTVAAQPTDRLAAGAIALLLVRLAASGSPAPAPLRHQAGVLAAQWARRALASHAAAESWQQLRAARLVAALAAALVDTLSAEPLPRTPAAIAAFMRRSANLTLFHQLQQPVGLALRMGWGECLRWLASQPQERDRNASRAGDAQLEVARACALQLQAAAAWPEHVVYLSPPLRAAARQAVFAVPDGAAAPDARVERPAVWWADACIAWQVGVQAQQLLRSDHAPSPAQSPTRPMEASLAPTSAPMAWDMDSLAQLTGGHWRHLDCQGGHRQVRGVHIHRPHAWPGAAQVLRSGDRPESDAQLAAPPAALLSDTAGPAPSHPRPTLQVPDVSLALVQLALAARQRILAPVVAVMGCAGKSTCIHMLQHLLGQDVDESRAALLHQSAALQLVNASDHASAVMVELALPAVAAEIALVSPDVVVVTHLAPADGADDAPPLCDELLGAMRLIKRGATVIAPLRVAASPAVRQLAAARHLRLLSCAADAAAELCWQPLSAAAVGEAALRMRVPGHEGDILASLPQGGAHLLENAAMALAGVWALQADLAAAARRLGSWQPMPGAGLTERLDDDVVLLDHSQARHCVAWRCALTQLQAIAPQPQRRLIVLCAATGEESFVGPLLREGAAAAAQARRVLLWGEPLRPLTAMARGDARIQWYEDLGHLSESLRRTLQRGDTVLIVGGARLSQALVIQALREHFRIVE
ncbi:hypothetical protein AAV94_02220 [Lampropedia cohaerens]|uniref:Mur ligase central domain-containing protein n=1 Tax=Lampropedia cohaerens TaxID=1610491 RepID=A0A0U1Q2L4_9BURK|nr:hypothetical protein [Lampropedia cohaerens]KKW68992.1 hypothetical protein AAV94_02220 [Lampropedia cohaerens]